MALIGLHADHSAREYKTCIKAPFFAFTCVNREPPENRRAPPWAGLAQSSPSASKRALLETGRRGGGLRFLRSRSGSTQRVSLAAGPLRVATAPCPCHKPLVHDAAQDPIMPLCALRRAPRAKLGWRSERFRLRISLGGSSKQVIAPARKSSGSSVPLYGYLSAVIDAPVAWAIGPHQDRKV